MKEKCNHSIGVVMDHDGLAIALEDNSDEPKHPKYGYHLQRINNGWYEKEDIVRFNYCPECGFKL